MRRIAAVIVLVLVSPTVWSDWTTHTALQIREAIEKGEVTAYDVTKLFLDKIAKLDESGPTLGAVLELNPDALGIARQLDVRQQQGSPMGRLHGVPVLLKANIDTADAMASSAGSLALATHRAEEDARLVQLLRADGAVVLGKTNLSEWANFRSMHSSSGWSSAGGQTKNPYVLDRNPCGSSSGSGVAVAARMAPLAIGTETNGSIVCPAGMNGVVGIKPTVGSVSAKGVIPIARSLDTAGPMANTVADALLLWEVIAGEEGRSAASLSETFKPNSRSANSEFRIGVVRSYFGTGNHPETEAAFEEAIRLLRELAAQIVDPVSLELPNSFSEHAYQVLLHEFKVGINRYLAARDDEPRSLRQLIAFNHAHSGTVMPHFDQGIFEQSVATSGLESETYRTAYVGSVVAMRDELERVFTEGDLDILIAPANAPAWKTDWVLGDHFSIGSSAIAAVSGYPSIALPYRLVRQLPVAVAFVGKPNTEYLLAKVAGEFERARGEFPVPEFIPSLETR